VVKIVDEQVQRVNALLKPLLQPAPLGRRDDARDDVEREDLFHSSLLAIHVERDPHLHQHALGGRLPPRKFPLRKRLNAVHQVGRAREGYLGIRQELVIEARYLVVGKVHEYKRNSSSASATNCRERKAFSRVGASGGDDGFQPRALFQNPANLHGNGTNRMIAPNANGAVQQDRVPQLAQYAQKGAASPAIRTGWCRRENNFLLRAFAGGTHLLFRAGLLGGFGIDGFEHPGCVRRNPPVIILGERYESLDYKLRPRPISSQGRRAVASGVRVLEALN
jgi:hypothetical protein